MASRKQLAPMALSVALVGIGIAAGLGMAARADSSVSVTVDASTSLGTLPATAFGINAAVWDGHLLDTSLPGLLQQAGAQVVRYPGGSTADVYHWQSNSTEPNQSYANSTRWSTHTDRTARPSLPCANPASEGRTYKTFPPIRW
jgi:hypothetical protein